MRSSMKKLLSILLTLVLVLGLGNINFASAATTPTKQNWLETMVAGDTATFAVNDATDYKIVWESSKTAVANVEKETGLVKAKKAGSVTIKATLTNGKKIVALTGNVTVKASQSIVANTQFGKVKGLKSGNIITWYGIPYGAEPVGDLRWSEPQDPAKWVGILKCNSKEAVALQYNGKTVIGSTNCLNLDVYAPTIKSENLPVYVFFHGGNNQTGSTFGDLTGADIVSNDNCIVVEVNYRLGLLGFNCLPALQTESGSTGNYGLLDMQKSLEWVRDNIKQFGGDPTNVTISGHSAGGRDAMVMLISPIFKGLFQKAIISSGGMTTSNVDQSASQIASILAPMAVKAGKAETAAAAQAWLLTNSKDVKDYLYSIPSDQLMSAIGDAGIRMSAFPHLYADDVTIPKAGFQTTAYNDVPAMMITGSDEFSAFNNGLAYTDGSIPSYELSAAKAFGNKYGSQMYGYFNALASAQTMTAKGYQSPIYLMDCNFGHDRTIWPEMAYGSYHGVALSFLDSKTVFRTAYFPAAFTTEGANQLDVLMHTYFRNFLWSNTGNPNSEGAVQWTKFTASNVKWMVLDATREQASSTMADISVKNYEQVFAAMDSDVSVSAATKAAVIKTVLNGRWFSSALDSKYGNASLWK